MQGADPQVSRRGGRSKQAEARMLCGHEKTGMQGVLAHLPVAMLAGSQNP